MLFLFVVMLLNLRADEFAPGRQWFTKLAAGLVVFAAGVELVRLLSGKLPVPGELPPGFGGYEMVGISLYTDYLLLVAVASLLLLAAIVGALILAKRRSYNFV